MNKWTYTTISLLDVIVLQCVSKNRDKFTYKKIDLETEKLVTKYSEWCFFLLIGKIFKGCRKAEQYCTEGDKIGHVPLSTRSIKFHFMT